MRRDRACLECGLWENRDCGRTEALEVGRIERLEGGRWVALEVGRDLFREDDRNERLEGGRLTPWLLFTDTFLDVIDNDIQNMSPWQDVVEGQKYT
jgi:hypothetical protein